MGGLPKKASKIEAFRKKNPEALLVVDSGNLLFKHATLSQGESWEKITARGIVRAYKEMKYDAVAIGPRDLAAGIEFFKAKAMPLFPWVSANLLDKNNAPIFSPWIISKKGGSSIGIIGLTQALSSSSANFQIVDWQTVLPPILATLAKKCDHIILLSNLKNSENYRIAKKYPSINVIITADSRFGNLGPLLNNNSLITQTVSQGKYLGNLLIRWGIAQKWDVHTTRSSSASTFSAHFIPLVSFLPESKKMRRLVDNIKREIGAFNRKRRQQIAESAIKTQRAKNTAPTFVGFKKCETCHKVQSTFWKSTQHAHAYSSLKRSGQENNPECLVCHVTHKEDLFTNSAADNSILLTLAQSMQSVGCEMCHGEGSAHVENPEKFKLILKPQEAVCLHCHTPKRDNNFDFPKKIERIRCPAN